MGKQKTGALAKANEPSILVRNNRDSRTPEDAEALKRLYQAKPELRRVFGDGLQMAFATQLVNAGLPPYEQDAVRLQADELRATLSEPEDNPLITMLINHAILCWLRLALTERIYTTVFHKADISIKTALFWEERLSGAQKRFTRACESLARTRKLLRPGKSKININAVIA